MIAEPELHSVELRIFHPEVHVRDVRPTQNDVEGLAPARPYVNASTAFRREVETGSIARRHVRTGDDCPVLLPTRRSLQERQVSYGIETAGTGQNLGRDGETRR